MTDKIDVLQAKVKEHAESKRKRVEMSDVTVGCVNVLEPRTERAEKTEPSDGKIAPFGLNDKLVPDIETKEKVSSAKVKQITKDIIDDVSHKGRASKRHGGNKDTK